MIQPFNAVSRGLDRTGVRFALVLGLFLGAGMSSRRVEADDAETQKAYEAAMAKGKSAGEAMEWESAVEAYEKALGLKAGDTAALAGIANAEQRLGKFVLVLDEAKNIRMEFVWIKPGKFRMGAEDGEDDEKPAHDVTISKGFWMGKTEVTQEQWQAVVGDKPSLSGGDKLPVDQVSFDDVHQKFLPKLKPRGKAAALPTEAEWEFACRAGSKTKFCFGDDAKQLGDYAWSTKNSVESRSSHAVADLKPNGWGLYDMHGNVWEKCEDWYGPYAAGAATNPAGPATGRRRVIRGGGWSFGAPDCRSPRRMQSDAANREFYSGFRVVLR